MCNFDELRYQKRKEVRRGTRAGSIGIFCAHEAIADAGLDWENVDRSTVGIYVGVTEHGNVETENEIYLLKGYDYDTQYLVAPPQPADGGQQPGRRDLAEPGHHRAALHAGRGLRRGQRGHHPGRADAAAGRLRPGPGRRRLGEHPHVRHLRQLPQPRALAKHDDPAKASRPFDVDRNGIVVAEGGCMFVLERLGDARARGAKIYGEIVGYAMNSDATDFVLPDPGRQAECIRLALRRAGLNPEEIDIVSTHATGTTSGDVQECQALRRVWGDNGRHTLFNNTKSFIGHAMGAAGALELAGNLPAFDDGVCHATINLDRLDPECRPARPGGQPAARGRPGRHDPEQLVRNAGHQLGGDREEDLITRLPFAALLNTIRTRPELTHGETAMTADEIREAMLDILHDIAPTKTSAI